MGKFYKLIFALVLAFIIINVNGQYAQPDYITIIKNTPSVIDVRANDSYSAEYYMTVPYQNDSGIDVIPPGHGSLAFINNYTIMYTPDSNFVGEDNFVYGIAVYDKLNFSIDTARVYVTVIEPDSSACHAYFTFTTNPTNNQVSFHGNNLLSFPGSSTSFQWNFGDSTFSGIQNPIHYFPSGIGHVCLTVTTTFGCSSTYCDSINIANTTCEAAFSYNHTNCPNCYHFEDNSTGNVIAWEWNFDDNTVFALQNPNYVFPDSGVYHICLTIHTDNNCSNTVCENIYIPYHVIITECNSIFSYKQDTVPGYQNRYFFNDYSLGNITSWHWDFDDEATSDLQNPEHIFETGGIFNVCLKINTSDSCTSTFCQQIHIDTSATCHAAFTFLSCSSNNQVTFSDISTGNIDSWNWQFGDYEVTALQNPQHAYPDSGLYHACLTIHTPGGCSSAYCLDIHLQHHTVSTKSFCVIVSTDNCLLPEGKVILYDTDSCFRAVAIETITPQSIGTACFDVLPGNYLIYAIPYYNYEQNYNKNYFPTYFGDSIFWSDAMVVNIDTISNLHINLFSSMIAPDYYGVGLIEGSITYTCDSTYETDIYGSNWFDEDSTNKDLTGTHYARHMPVILLNENNVPVKFLLSKSAGNFSFRHLANGSYKIYTEKAGLLTLPVGVTLNSQNQNTEGISITIGSTTISGDSEELLFNDMNKSLLLYPVPIKDWLNVSIDVSNKTDVTVIIENISGQALVSKKLSLNEGINRTRLNLGSLDHGVYFLRFISGNGKIITKPFVK
ncbi:MAG: T9SS type A sorting domain-containing protein [Bacteroidetes bacterium]|nr:T9SS type A sorting domain-containing protein [Bacteroidota bacterium]